MSATSPLSADAFSRAARWILPVLCVLLGGASLARGQGSLVWTFNGAAPSDDLGASVAGVGDVNGDGVPDLLVGAPSLGTGYAKVFSGVTETVLFTFLGSGGSSVANAGDVNGDGFSDPIVGAPEAPGGLALTGQARVF